MDFRHANPANSNWINVHLPGNGGTRTEFDPLGATVGIFDPFPGQLSYINLLGNEFLYSELGNPFDLGGGCVLDGMPVSCSSVSRESAVQCPNNDCGPRVDRDGNLTQPFQAFGDGHSGFLPWGTHYIGDGRYASGGPPGDRREGVLEENDFADSFPQNAQQVMVRMKDVNELKRLMEERLAYGDCREAVARLIATAESMSKSIDKIENAALSTDVMSLFAQINAMPNGGGYHINFLKSDLPKNLPPVSGGSGLATGTIGGRNANAWIFLKGGFSDNPASISRLPFDYGISGIHETIHLAGRSSIYSEALMDAAARALDRSANSDFDRYLFEHCLPPNLRGF